VRSDLVETLERIGDLLDRGEILPLSRVVIETTGLAEPAGLLQSVLSDPAIGRRFALDGVITVVDGVHAIATLAEHAEARSQIAIADRLILTKTDHPEAQAQAVELAELLKRLAPHALQLDAAAGEAEPAVLFGTTRWFPSPQADDSTPAHQGDIRTTTLWRDRPLPPAALGLFADFMRSSQGAKILRLKGLVQLTDDPERPLVIHGVRHMFDRPRRLDEWPDEDRRTRIVVIGKDLDTGLIGQLYDAFSGGPQMLLPS
jgi:G3E family GTPase